MGNFIRTVGLGGSAKSPAVKRAVGNLSDGTVVMMVVDSNQSGVSGDGGDGTDVPKIYLYHSSDRVNWTLKATITSNSGAQASEFVASMVVDSANNVHIAYVNENTEAVRYVMCTYSAGPTWSVGTQVNLVASAGQWTAPFRVDIDTMGNTTNVLVITAHYFTESAGSPKSCTVMQWVRTTTGSWIIQPKIDLITGTTQAPYTDDLTVSGDTTPIGGDNVAIYVFCATRKSTNGTDFGDVLWLVRVNAATGARISATQVKAGFNRGLNNGYRTYHLFASGNGEWILAGSVGNSPWKVCVLKFRWNRFVGEYQEIAPLSTSASLIAVTRNAYTSNWATAAYAGGGKVMFVATGTGGALAATMASIDGGSVKFSNGSRAFDDQYKFNGVPVDLVFSGATRNFGASRLDVLLFYYKTSSVNAYRMESISKRDPLAPANVRPAGTTVTSDRPQLAAEHKLAKKFAQARVKMEWQIASDAGFTTNARTITESDTDLVIADFTTSPDNAIVRALEGIPGISELFQGTWYLRARSLDEAGAYGPFSAAKSFVVSHPPSAMNLYPTAGTVFVWGGSGNVTFTWDFSDPSGSDTQTAYQIVVEDATTQTVLLDTDKVTSTLDSATITLPPTAKDIDLRWRLKVWDSDDVAGNFSDYNLFYVADPPTPSITSPLPDEVLSTAVPVITWTQGLGGTREQRSYRVRVSQGSTLIYTSNWVISASNTHQIPVGTLKNNQEYTITVDLRDNLALEGTSFVAVSTSWTPPSGPSLSPLAFVHEYDKRGFVYVTWTNQGRDPDFIAWVVYRRARGEGEWAQLAQYSSGSDRYAHRDYLAGTGQTYEYTVTQVVNRFGDVLESPIHDIVSVTPRSDQYWLIDPSELSLALQLIGVTGDKYTEEYESEKMHIKGRGIRVEYGDRLGYVGSLSMSMRDRQIFAAGNVNYAHNPTLSISSADLEVPEGWSIGSEGVVGAVIGEYVDTINPSPTGRVPFRLRADDMGVAATDKISLTQLLDGNDYPEKFKSPGTKVTISAWVGNSENNISKNYRILVKWLDSVGGTIAQVGTGPLKPAVHAIDSYIKSYTEDGKAGLPIGRWKRLQFICFVPSPVPSGMEVTFQLEGDPTGTGTAPAELMITGIQVQAGNLTEYFDGDSAAGIWRNAPGLSASETTGYYTARQQRQALMRMKALKTSLYLRNPFGDVWLVAPGDIGVDRVAGVGTAEFVNAELPYQETDF